MQECARLRELATGRRLLTWLRRKRWLRRALSLCKWLQPYAPALAAAGLTAAGLVYAHPALAAMKQALQEKLKLLMPRDGE